MAANTVKKDYLLALKVMRLTRPTLVAPDIIASESSDLPGKLFEKLSLNDAIVSKANENISDGQFMLLPQSFGNIYLGETFSSYICLHNCTTHPVQGISVSAELQSDKAKILLPINESKQMPYTLHPHETLDDVIHHEVREIGVHILVCEVHYKTPAGLDESFRKFFKFHVLKPLDVQTKFYNAETDEVYLEVQIQNITAGPICLETVDLQCTDKYTMTSLNTLSNGESVFKSKNMLQPQNACQFLYCIKPMPALIGNVKQLKLEKNIGKLDILWRSNLGERGRLQTSQLERSPIDYGDIRLTVIEAKNVVRIGDLFDFTCRITNTSERPMDLHLKLIAKSQPGSDYTGTTDFSLGSIEVEHSKDIRLSVNPVKIGLISITQLQLTDVFLKRTYEFEDIVQVLVVDKDYCDDEQFEMDKYVRYSTEAVINASTISIPLI